jgi:hypothetical protein
MDIYKLKLSILNAEESIRQYKESFTFNWAVGEPISFKLPSDLTDKMYEKKLQIKQEAAKEMLELLKATLKELESRS